MRVSDEEAVLPLPSPLAPARHARSTILLGSLAVVREAGKLATYEAQLTPAHRDIVRNMVAGAWIPMDVAFAHYEACDALGWSPDQQVANGRATFDKTSGTLLGTLVRMAREAGATPWTVFPHFQRYWDRGYDGGGVGVVKLGPKEARVDLVGCHLAESRYYRNALRGLVNGIVSTFCAKAYVTERPAPRAPGAVSMRVQWA